VIAQPTHLPTKAQKIHTPPLDRRLVGLHKLKHHIKQSKWRTTILSVENGTEMKMEGATMQTLIHNKLIQNVPPVPLSAFQ
jgi:hypothetical protein